VVAVVVVQVVDLRQHLAVPVVRVAVARVVVHRALKMALLGLLTVAAGVVAEAHFRVLQLRLVVLAVVES
jgi:hypothetical protein